MEFDNKTKSLENVFDQRWKANNYRTNGVIDEMEKAKDHFNRINNIKSKEEQRNEVLKATSIEGRLERLNQQMNVVKDLNNHRF